MQRPTHCLCKRTQFNTKIPTIRLCVCACECENAPLAWSKLFLFIFSREFNYFPFRLRKKQKKNNSLFVLVSIESSCRKRERDRQKRKRTKRRRKTITSKNDEENENMILSYFRIILFSLEIMTMNLLSMKCNHMINPSVIAFFALIPIWTYTLDRAFIYFFPNFFPIFFKFYPNSSLALLRNQNHFFSWIQVTWH